MCGIETLLIGALVSAGSQMLAPKPDYSGALARNDEATKASLAALDAQKAALEKASQLTTPLADNSNAQRAADARRRKLAQVPGTTYAGDTLGDAPVGYKMLMGA